MNPKAFFYHRVQSVNEAIQLLSELGEDAKPIAGGQTLLPVLKMRMDEPAALVDIGRLSELYYIHTDEDMIRIGALSTHDYIARSSVAALVPIIGDCAGKIADQQVRNRGTIGGSLSVADPANDWPTLLHTLDAEIVCHGVNGSRSIMMKDFIEGSYTTVLEHAELVTEIRFKVPPENSGGAYLTFKQAAPAYPIAAAGVQLTLSDDDICQDVRFVLGCAGPKAVTSVEAEAQLRGKSCSTENLQRAAEAILVEAKPTADARGSVQFKQSMLHKLFMKSVNIALNRARGT